MPKINLASVMGKVQAYADSNEGKTRIAKFIKECRDSGNGKLSSGDYIVTQQDMIRAAEALISILKEVAKQKSLPESVQKHFDSLYYNDPIPYGKEGKQYKIDIQFEDDLSRMSLKIASGKNAGKRTGEGIDNIVSLFDTGYNAKGSVYGVWENHTNNEIYSLSYRDSLNFMEEALNTFNREYGKLYNVFAYISSEDPRFYTSSRNLGDGLFL